MSQQNSAILTSHFSPVSIKSQEIKATITALKSLLKKAGFLLSFGEEPHILTQEQALVVRDMEKNFMTSQQNVEEFMKGLKLLCRQEKYFKKALLPTRLKNDSTGGEQQDSLFRLLLKIECIQKNIIDILLNEINLVVSEEIDDTSWLRILINPLKYLPHVNEAENLVMKLLDVLDIATLPAQLEILDSLPEIIPDSQYCETAKQLSKLLDEKDELSGAIIDCLNALELDSELRSQVQDKILAKVLAGTTLQIFPVLLQFLMTEFKSQNLVPTLLKIRSALDTIMLSNESNKEKESCKVLIFNRLEDYAKSPKIVAESWLNAISSIKVHSDHKPIDYLILFMLHTTAKFKKRIIEAIFRKRVHDGLFKVSWLEKLFEKYIPQQLLKDYFNSILEIGCSLLRYPNDQYVTEFASTLFKILFTHEYMQAIYRKEILDGLILLSGASDKKTVSCVLRILSSLLTAREKLQQNIALLMRLLEKLDTFELKDVQLVFEILCTLTCTDESMSGLKDEIHMIIRKLLSSAKKHIKHKGIVSSVVMAKHLALTSGSSEDNSPSTKEITVTLATLPQGATKEAISLLELTSTCASGCPEYMGLYYDQLALMLMTNHHLDKYFMAWLYQTITEDFESTYVTNHVDGSESSMQYLLNSSEEMDTPLGVNIAGLTATCENGLILLLAPHFRLLRLLHYRQKAGDLSNIDALLGCSVIMPQVEDYIDLDSHQIKRVADCLFHCVNWFRETISGFVTQRDKSLRAKVVQRLQDLLEIEKKLQSCLENIPGHKFPVSYFASITEIDKQTTTVTSHYKKKNNSKKLKSADLEETAASTAGQSQTKRKKSITKSTDSPITFRELDTDVILLFKYPLQLEEGVEYSTQTASLSIQQLKFLLKDFVSKLSALIEGKDLGISHLNMVLPIHIIQDGVFILTHLDSHLKIIIKKINKLLEQTDGRHDLPEMFTEESVDIKNCFGLILETFHLIFSWPEFHHSSNLEILKKLLKCMRPEQSQTLNSATRLIVEFINRLANYSDQCLQLSHSVSLVKTMEKLYSLTVPSLEVQKKIVSTASKLLNKRWYNSKGNLDVGKNCNMDINVLVKAYLNGANIQTICGLVGTLQEQAPLLNTKEDCLQMLVSIDKQNFHILYMGFCNALLNRVKTEVQALTNSEHLVLWQTTALTMQGLMTVAKARETRTNLVCFLKKSIGVLKIFLSHGIPILEITLRSNPDDIVAIFKNMQTTTRFLHHLCCYSKLTKDSSLMAYVPKFRLTLETLVYRVKAALVANNCSEAFWMGNLRNRDLHGDDILSQTTSVTDGNNENDEEILPSDESEEDDIVNNSAANARSSESDVFD